MLQTEHINQQELLIEIYYVVVNVDEGHSTITVVIAKQIHLFPYRTQSLRASTLTILGW